MTLEGYRYITPQVTSDDPRMQRAIDGWLGLYEACYVIGNELREGRRKLIEEGLVAAEDGEPYGMDSREHRPTPEQLFKAVVHGAKGLNEAGARYVLAGGLALNYHGHERATRDVDFFVCHDPEKLDELRGPLARQDVRPHREEGPSFLPPDAMFWFEPLQFGLPDAPPVNVDLLVSQHEFMALPACDRNRIVLWGCALASRWLGRVLGPEAARLP
ncbi:MAG: nucleotidyl transferase AbiEii/AbiGii toxin family protein [Planctomycetota bacterium]|nr:nucleotidyl transferase AbiEii/AbiGii toxin family protein [Planctomycetota bacterium]